MRLRRLKIQDAIVMLEWMHCREVTAFLHTDFASKTQRDAEDFIKTSWENKYEQHYAIVSDEDEYMGTVSLKHIHGFSAEFAIVVREKAMGHGYSWFAMEEILKKAFDEFGLESVYWCVSRKNERAIRFYDKHQFKETIDIPESIQKRYDNIYDLKWYSVLKGDDYNTKAEVAGCKVIRIKTIPTINAGELSFFQTEDDIGFEIKRIYYITKVPEGVRRGYHAHKELKQILFCPFGRIQLVLENRHGREEIELSDPSVGVIIEEPTWREMIWIQSNSVLFIAASDYYKPDDYIRDYSEFRKKYLGIV